MHARFWIVSDFPITVGRDDRNRPHCDDGPQLAWRDGWRVYNVHGVRVPADIIERPESITVERIDGESNAEIRRIMVDRYGRERYIRDSGAKLLHEDLDELGLPRRLWRREWPDGRTLQLVEVHNSTLEPDGTRRVFFLGVHPEIRPLLGQGRLGDPQSSTCLNAVASLAGLRGEDYRPGIQT
jgi:hypothetical protein